MLVIENAVEVGFLNELQSVLDSGQFVDGRNTASGAVESVKDNLQLDFRDPAYPRADSMVRQRLAALEAIQEYAVPVRSSNVLFSRYSAGNSYGDHVDAPMMRSGNQLIRADVSFTLFLCPPEDYEGGELIINSMGIEQAVKGQRGDVVAYPSDSLHRVAPITSGTRQVAVGWLQSLIASPIQRQVLYDMAIAKRLMYEGSGKSQEFDLISKCFVNLKRMWGNP